MNYVHRNIKLGDAGNVPVVSVISRDQVKKKSIKKLENTFIKNKHNIRKGINSQILPPYHYKMIVATNYRLPISLDLPNIQCTSNKSRHSSCSEGQQTSNGRYWKQCGQEELEFQKNIGERTMGRQKRKLNKMWEKKPLLNTSPIPMGVHGDDPENIKRMNSLQGPPGQTRRGRKNV